MSYHISSLQSSLQPCLSHAVFRNQRILLTALASTVVGLPLLRIAVLDYRAYHALGAGGVPHNIVGWLAQLVLRPITKEPFHTSCYDDAKTIAQAGPNGSTAFLSLDDVPRRDPSRPKVGSWVVPHRQITDCASSDVKTRFQAFLASLASASPSRLIIATSLAEGHGPALYVAPSSRQHPIAQKTRGEIGHMHDSDGAIHVNLAPKDAKLVLERGWGQRHGLSGRVLYVGLVMIYAPRGEEELLVVERIVQAGVKFMLGQGSP